MKKNYIEDFINPKYYVHLDLFKETGKSIIIKIDTDMEIFNLLLSRLLRDC